MVTKAEEAPKGVTSGKVVKYIGTSDIREIDGSAWKSLGVEGQSKVIWSKANRWQVPVADLADGAVRYLEEDDASFVVTDADT